MMCALGERTFYRAKVWGVRVLTSGGALLRTTVCFLLVGVVWAWVVSLAGHPAGGGTFLFRQESTQRRGLLGRRWGRAFLACGSRGLGGPSRSRPPLRTPPGTLRGVGQGCDLVIAVGDHFPLSSVHSFSLSRHAACFVAGWGSGENGSSRRAGPSSGRQWFLGIVSLITFHFPLSTVNCPLVSSSRYAACFVTGRGSGESGSSRRAGPSSGRQCVFWAGGDFSGLGGFFGCVPCRGRAGM